MKRRKGRTVAIVAGAGVLALALLLGVYREEIAVWIKFVRTFEDIGTNDQGYAEYRHRQTGIVFVRVPGGTFSMGSSQEELERMQEKFEAWTDESFHDQSQHKVTLSSFLVAKYEVSQAQWKKFMGNNPSKFKGDVLPVEGVSWNDCEEFCGKSGLSLPTEAQWEYACRAGKSGHFSGTGKIDEMGWCRENSNKRVHSVGEKEPNDFGLHDMHGNVFEYCEDVVFAGKTKGGKDLVWFTGNRVIRGGGWNNFAWLCRSASRLSMNPTLPGGGVGFRPVYGSEWPGGVSPPGSPRTVRERLRSHGSYHPTVHDIANSCVPATGSSHRSG